MVERGAKYLTLFSRNAGDGEKTGSFAE